jgi:hypothetical protein
MSLCRRKVSAAYTPRNVYTTIDATGYARRSRSLAKASLFARCRSADAATRRGHHKRCQNANDGQGNLGLAAHRKRVARRTSCSPIVLATRSPPTAECCCWESPLPACTGAYGLSTSHAEEPFHSHAFARGSSMDTPKRQSLARTRVVHDKGRLGRGPARKSEEAIVLSETPGSTQPLYTLSTPSRKRERLAIPSKILWPGFLANTVFWACLLWSCLALVRFARRTLRQKQGLCGHCGYPASGAVCGECGERNRSHGRLDSPPTTSPHAP